MSALKVNFLRMNFRLEHFDSMSVTQLLKTMSKSKLTMVILKGVFTDSQLQLFFAINSSFHDHIPYTLAYSLALLAFLRISKLVPPTEITFDINKHLVMRDVQLLSDGLLVHLKWTKNLQRSDQFHVVKVPRLSDRLAMCPVMAYLKRKHSAIGPTSIPLTERNLGMRMAVILTRMKLRNAGLTFHAFRRTGVTISFGQNVPLQAIRAHGAWASDTVWQYVKHTNEATSIVPSALATILA